MASITVTEKFAGEPEGPRAHTTSKEDLVEIKEKSKGPKISRFIKRVVSAQGQERLMVGTKAEDVELASQGGFLVIDRDEEGELVVFEMEVDSTNIALEIQFRGDSGTQLTFCDDTMAQFLRKGRGITPGDAETVSSNRTKDPTGVPLNNLPYLGRYKDEEFTDYLNETRRTIVARFDPVNPWAYSGVTIKIKNYNLLETEHKTIRSLLLVRYVYGDFNEMQGQELHPEDLALPTPEDEGFSPIDEEEVDTDIDVEETQEEDIEFSPAGAQKMSEEEVQEEGEVVRDDRPGFMRG